jgi:hypothetical protein
MTWPGTYAGLGILFVPVSEPTAGSEAAITAQATANSVAFHASMFRFDKFIVLSLPPDHSCVCHFAKLLRPGVFLFRFTLHSSDTLSHKIFVKIPN